MSKQPKPDSKKYIDLISEIQKGQIKVPKFQRNFVWSLDKTAKLLDSILKSYPIGTFILWETNERLNDIKNIGNLELPAIPDGTKVQYVLDGQQRITSLYSAFLGAQIKKEGEKKITDYANIFVDLEGDVENNDEQIVVSEEPEGIFITLHEILNFNDHFLEIKEKYSDEHLKKIHLYSQAFSTYDFSTIVLRKEDIDSAIEVFTRINTGGQTLTLFEIISAKTYDEEQKFDMEDKFRKLMETLTERKYNGISSSVILSILSLVLSKNKECKRKTILQLEKQSIIDTWDNVISALKESIDYFRSVYRIPVSAILPYDSLLVPFAYFFYYQKEKPKGEQVKYLEEFFWRISLSSRYSSSTESRLARDVKRIDEILKGNRPNYDDIKVDLNSPKDLIETSFSAGSSYCKAVLCLLAYHEPKDFQDNGRVILDNSWLKIANSKNFHHFFPKAYLRKNNIGNENSLVNISLVSADLNKRKIKAKAPSVYVQDFLDENYELPTTLKSHLIEDLDAFGLKSDDYLVFLEKRADIMFKELKDRIDLRHKEDRKEDDLRELISRIEDEKLEMKSTLRFDLLEGSINKKLEYVVAKTISAFLNSEGGTLIIGVDDDGNILGLEKDMETLSKQNSDGFELHLRQVIKKYLGENYEKYLKISFPKIEDKEICLIKISKSGKPVFVNFEGNESFFVRIGNSSIPKNRQEQSEYEKLHWN
ncbi:MAG: hypothetical protein ACD_51C00183G0008 [uncultured bacterium]|nr:MAG: hypothetical protein ACD_51C00183G0008 [uncultured bacterium]OGJ47518.1 MAG: hypothetical protein A2244_02035 [Candidatus Peregrinibacteria bacterium RIFOXYA2_FULL_41_18]OGJ48937.1 MAG: hypothetical protein A2344_03350 [Candidatus Peregrinibacteria bacterium RIFOXYB12_FULL_41_12]OGJ51489.1 MAG: hypothetical protein A2336_02230 [Candidatus Peregrinibacteria bacterium RIFOXYB2_FULL_41_88]OGJ52594.1 MAG: hypothetical protein A2448_02440 [Candidatus Peregrinibacteria bacterium RIFOXYC2_FULL